MGDRAITVTQLNEYVGTLLSGDPLLRGLKVTGEISGFKRHTSGHIYFSLKDETAVVRCVMFRAAAQSLDFVPQDGMRVLTGGYASLYVRDGQYQLYVQSMQKEGEGELYRRFLLLKTKLEAMGYFNPDHKRPIPYLPRCVGIVTSPTGAALQDILQIIRRRFPNMDVQICPVLVQGAGAAEDIAAGIRAMNRLSRASVLIVGRGGGSIEDLWAFNEPAVAKAIYESRIPVISAVGHETDFSIADFTADLRAPTPSAAAELCVPQYDSLLQHTDALISERLPRALSRSISAKRDRLLLLLHARGFSAAEHSLILKRQILGNTVSRLHIAVAHSMQGKCAVTRGLMQRLQPLSPDAALQRGFAIVTSSEGKVLSSISDVAPEAEIILRMKGGEADARVGKTRTYEQTV